MLSRTKKGIVLGVALVLTSGCQTWVPSAGMTLPSPHYLEHRPQFIPESPAFPLSRELANMQEQAAAAQVAPAAPPPAAPIIP
ncbi:MAG: hypothetical protein KatS3mg105_3379 [Gemmatales bacterium]|nr:MAG: hypothetical protein KatS3mg105_3379 [Gemmatales bacterium]